MKASAPRAIKPARAVDATVSVPPSKSYTNRAYIAAALADGTSRILNPSPSDDSETLLAALQEFGVAVTKSGEGVAIEGSGGAITPPKRTIDVGNAGTAMRFLAAFAALAPGTTTLDGDEQMRRRPMTDLLAALKMAGIRCASANGCPPVEIHGGNFLGGSIEIDAAISSQYLSAILLAAPYAKRPTTIHVRGKVSSFPYIDMTLHVMRSFGAVFDDIDTRFFRIGHGQRYIGHDFTVEADASAASYFLAAAAVTGGRVAIGNLTPESVQGDIRFLGVLTEMGCTAEAGADGISLRGGRLRGIEIDMNAIPDCVPTLAVVAAFAEGSTVIHNVEHLRYKETNRLTALAAELSKIGAGAELSDDGIIIHPGPLNQIGPATIETYNDHRIAMGFAVAGLKAPGIAIANPACVSKSFPDFWNEFKKLEG